jgi:hypothetical protein
VIVSTGLLAMLATTTDAAPPLEAAARARVLDTPFLLPALDGGVVFFLVLFLATLVVHLVFAAYTLGGACFVLACALRGKYSPGASRDALALCVRDWLPSAASGAITAGIAPLLFVQLVYQKAFYSANLLLFNRWMAILPVLIAAIYAMYLVKAKHRCTSRAARTAAALAVAGLVGFVAAAFVENHLLSLDPESWPSVYESGQSSVPSTVHAARLACWCAGALPVFALLAAWQLRFGAADADEADRARAARSLGGIALGGTIGSIVAALVYARVSPEVAEAATSAAGRPYAAVLALGTAVVIAAWIRIVLARDLSRGMLATASVATAIAMTGAAFVRESMRLAALVGTVAAPREPRNAAGFVVFALFAVAGLATIAWILRAVSRDMRTTGAAR